MKLYILILAIALVACSSTENDSSSPAQDNNVSQNLTSQTPESAVDNVPESERVYFFQHRILPEWTFTTEGLFFEDLIRGEFSKLKQAATDIVSKDFAENLDVLQIPTKDAVLITFPEPRGLTNCFFVIIQRTNNSFSYYTYEKTMSFGDDDHFKGVVGTWSSEGSHGNLGPRTYTSPANFIEDVLGK
ncbi:hypothetical protein [Glaciecola sp. 1036]|uniref:hypothetical protein n=1 Tax=Alteromonadaceae TaxID=72275 RepID=UPI003CFE7B59